MEWSFYQKDKYGNIKPGGFYPITELLWAFYVSLFWFRSRWELLVQTYGKRILWKHYWSWVNRWKKSRSHLLVFKHIKFYKYYSGDPVNPVSYFLF